MLYRLQEENISEVESHLKSKELKKKWNFSSASCETKSTTFGDPGTPSNLCVLCKRHWRILWAGNWIVTTLPVLCLGSALVLLGSKLLAFTFDPKHLKSWATHGGREYHHPSVHTSSSFSSWCWLVFLISVQVLST